MVDGDVRRLSSRDSSVPNSSVLAATSSSEPALVVANPDAVGAPVPDTENLQQALVRPVQMWKGTEHSIVRSQRSRELERSERLSKIVPVTKDPYPQKRIPSTHLKEDHYAEVVDSLIERDYFPDLPSLRLQHGLAVAERRGDHHAAAEFRHRLAAMTPATPLVSKPAVVTEDGDKSATSKDQRLEVSLVDGSSRVLDLAGTTLDKFQARYTSEDNASFEKLIEKDKSKRRQKESWVEDAERKHNQNVGSIRLAVQDGEQLQGQLQLGNHDARSVMYFQHKHDPKGTKQHARNVEVSVNRHNTRFASGTERDVNTKNHDMAPGDTDVISGSQQDHTTATTSPKYRTLATPVIDPANAGASPLMTYGTVVSTPLLLNDQDSKDSGNIFKIPEASSRDELAHKMASRALHQRRSSDQKSYLSSARTSRGASVRTGTVFRPTASTAGDRLRRKMGLTAGSSIGLTSAPGTGRPTPSALSKSARSSMARTPQLVTGAAAVTQHKRRRTDASDELVPNTFYGYHQFFLCSA